MTKITLHYLIILVLHIFTLNLCVGQNEIQFQKKRINNQSTLKKQITTLLDTPKFVLTNKINSTSTNDLKYIEIVDNNVLLLSTISENNRNKIESVVLKLAQNSSINFSKINLLKKLKHLHIIFENQDIDFIQVLNQLENLNRDDIIISYQISIPQ
ncbi:hypothetical protein FIA58_010040 [Flavobacterium jejuense]|uniref:DUF4252 domain-containing protein n=1 Tax=Flavobacterium jejuense TaxID=1544455 RepID=A0ABX0IT66_9FLAO|nr:hypothetical protein [Flavobacterium jejuense]NHN26014.1 hypothetical protein [Flavobacterium jejuense]